MRIKLFFLVFFASLLLASPAQAKEVRYSVVIKKAERKLYLYEEKKLKKTYPIALGTTPKGAKAKEGDRKTPEGSYYICRKNPKSQFYLSLGLSYPNKADAARGLKAKLINKRQHDRIVRAIDRGECPPWDTELGGEVFIHGNGSKPDWTWGCVAMDDPQIKELYDLLDVGTKVTIDP
jgi:murein L,D-transpeptidase YafK